jgi:uncharacterized membrane protein (UPF0127 family)
MRFPIDVVFVSRAGEVLKVGRSVPPWRTSAARGAKVVIELGAGEADRNGISVGTRLDLSGSAASGSGPAAGHPPVSG